MNTCGTCKHFGPIVETISVYHECLLLEHLNAARPCMTAPIAGVIDGSGYYATLCVKHDFGCNQWEQKK